MEGLVLSLLRMGSPTNLCANLNQQCQNNNDNPCFLANANYKIQFSWQKQRLLMKYWVPIQSSNHYYEHTTTGVLNRFILLMVSEAYVSGRPLCFCLE